MDFEILPEDYAKYGEIFQQMQPVLGKLSGSQVKEVSAKFNEFLLVFLILEAY